MPWIKIDDQFADHPKVVAAGPLAAWLHVCGLCYCGRYLTDGFIPRGQVRKLADVDDVTPLLTQLITVGLWDECEGGYQIHDYLEYNPSGEQVKAERKANAERQKTYRERHRKPNGRFGSDNSDSNADSNAVTNDGVTTAPSPSPSPISTNGADAPAPTTLTEWQSGLAEASNKAGYVGLMLKTLYPSYYGKHKAPNYGFIGGLLKKHDPDYMLSLIWQYSARPPTGDPARFVAGALSKNTGAASSTGGWRIPG